MAAGDIVVVHENAAAKKGNYFEGTDDYVLHDAHAVARVGANDTVGTYTAWIYADDITVSKCILSAGDNDSANEYLNFWIVAGLLKIKLRHGGATQFEVQQTAATMESKKWYHVAVVQNGTQPALYIDGEAVATTNATATDLTYWYDELTGCDKFAIGVLESNNTHTNDWKGAIGPVRYYATNLTAAEVLEVSKGNTTLTTDTVRQAVLDTALVFNVTYENDGTTDSGSGADDGTLTGGAIYGGEISDWSYKINQNVTGHAAEFINTVIDGNKFRTLIKRGD